MTTMTKVAKFNAIAEMVGADAVFEDGSNISEFLAHEVEMTNKRNSRKSGKPSKAQIANDELFANIVAFVTDNGGDVLAKDVASHFEVTSQKISGVVRTHNGLTKVDSKDGVHYTISDTSTN